jgi:hypothetical protein
LCHPSLSLYTTRTFNTLRSGSTIIRSPRPFYDDVHDTVLFFFKYIKIEKPVESIATYSCVDRKSSSQTSTDYGMILFVVVYIKIIMSVNLFFFRHNFWFNLIVRWHNNIMWNVNIKFIIHFRKLLRSVLALIIAIFLCVDRPIGTRDDNN